MSATAPAIANIAYGSSGLFVPIAKGTNFEIRITPAGTKDVIYDSVPQTFAEHSGATIVAFSKGSGKLVNVALLRQDDAGSGALVDNLLTQYKVVNASLVPSPLNVFVDGSLQLSNIPYTGVSNYQQTSTGVHNFSFEATATPGATLLTLVQTLDRGHRHLDRPDRNRRRAGRRWCCRTTTCRRRSSTANVRFVNSSADVAAFDVFVNFSKQVSGLATEQRFGIHQSQRGRLDRNRYEFDFNLAGTTTSLLKLTSVVLTAGHTYTVYLAGPSSSLRGIVSQDN